MMSTRLSQNVWIGTSYRLRVIANPQLYVTANRTRENGVRAEGETVSGAVTAGLITALRARTPGQAGYGRSNDTKAVVNPADPTQQRV